MRVTITKLRQDLFRLADMALEGKPVQFTYKGALLHIVPEVKPSKLKQLVRQSVTAPRKRLDRAGRDLLKQMQAEWEKDWAEL